MIHSQATDCPSWGVSHQPGHGLFPPENTQQPGCSLAMEQHSQRLWYAAPTPPPQVELNSPEPWSTLSLGFKIFSCKTERIVIATLWSYYCWGLNDLIHVKALTPITSLFSLPLSSQPIQPPSALLSTRRTPCTHQCWAETALVLLFVVFWATHLWVSSHLLGILYTVVWMAHSTIVDLFPPF